MFLHLLFTLLPFRIYLCDSGLMPLYSIQFMYWSSFNCCDHIKLNMASSRPGRIRNPTLKASADVNGDFTSLLPYQQRQALEASAARKAAERPVNASSTPQPPPDVLPSPIDNSADNGGNLNPGPATTTSRSSSNHPPSPSAISDNKDIASSGGDEAPDATRLKTRKRQRSAADDLGELQLAVYI